MTITYTYGEHRGEAEAPTSFTFAISIRQRKALASMTFAPLPLVYGPFDDSAAVSFAGSPAPINLELV